MLLDLTKHDERDAWLTMYEYLWNHGKRVSPRGLNTLEVQDWQCRMNPWNRYPTFAERKFNHRYVYAEFLWYLRGDPTDVETIARYAPFWRNIIDDPSNPFIWSQYGRYIWGEGQLLNAARQLRDDKDSRKASIVIATKDNYLLPSDAKDTVCTYAINFSIRDNELQMHVSMRSNDFIRGFQSDFFQFSMLQEIMFNLLSKWYPDIKMGFYTHKTDSMHIYERHWKMAEKILNSEGKNYEPTPAEKLIPKIAGWEDAVEIVTYKENAIKSPTIRFARRFTEWEARRES